MRCPRCGEVIGIAVDDITDGADGLTFHVAIGCSHCEWEPAHITTDRARVTHRFAEQIRVTPLPVHRALVLRSVETTSLDEGAA